jgi:hypothetical protein
MNELHLEKDYNDLTLSERCNAVRAARAAGYDCGHCDEDGPFSEDPLGPRQPAATLEVAGINNQEFFLTLVEPAWQADEITEEQMQALKDTHLDDPRKDAFEAGLREGRKALADEIIAEEAD